MKNEKVSVQRGAYFHELFIRGKEDLCLQITRQKGKGVQQEDTSDRFHNSGVESIKLSSCLRKISELMGAKEARELRITKPKKEVSITQSLYMRAKEENAGSESEVADDEVLQMKRRIDLMLACYQTKEAPTKIPTLTHHDNVREREGGETTFAGKRFHDVECNIMGNNSSVVAQAPTSADHVWSFGQVVQMAPRGDIVMKAGMKNPAA